MLRRFETIATDAGHTVVRMNVTEYEVAGCLGCDGCQGDLEDFGCLQADACEEILRQILSADLTVYACAGLLLEFLRLKSKALIDRHYCTVKWQAGEVAARLLKVKRSALLLTCGGGAEDNADLTLPMFERQMDYIGGEILGMYVLDNCTSPLAGRGHRRRSTRSADGERIAQSSLTTVPATDCPRDEAVSGPSSRAETRRAH